MTMQQQRSARGARFKALVIIVVLFTVMQGSALWRLVYYDFTDNGEGWTYAHPGGGSAEARSSGVSSPVVVSKRHNKNIATVDDLLDLTFLKRHPLPFQYEPRGAPYSVCRKRMGRGEEGYMGYKGLQKIQIISSTNNKTGTPDPAAPRILCVVYSNATRHERILAAAETYGSKCDGFLVAFSSDRTKNYNTSIQNLLPTILVKGIPGGWEMMQRILRYLHRHHQDDFDVFHICGDDTYVIVENLRSLLTTDRFDPATSNDSMVLGSAHLMSISGGLYCNWDAGIALNRVALSRLVEEVLEKDPGRWTNKKNERGDFVLSQALMDIETQCIDPLDHDGAPRYHRMDVHSQASYFKLLYTIEEHEIRTTLEQNYNIPFHVMLDSISPSSITFALNAKLVPSMFPDGGLRRYHAILYGLCQSRTMELEPLEPAEKLAGTHPFAGALDVNGKSGYIHDATFVKNHPLKLEKLGPICSVPRGKGEEGSHGDQALRKIKVHAVPVNRTTRKVLCAVYTHSNRHHAIRAIAETWGPQCDGFLAASNATDPSIGAVNLLHEGEEAYKNMWQKVRAMWAYIYDHYLTDYDYFYICGDDTYVIPDNLRYSVSLMHSDPDEILYMGRKMGDFPRPRRAYCGGGAGYTLSRGAVRTFVRELFPRQDCWPNATASDEDRIVASCFRDIGVSCMDDVDERNEPRYHIEHADFHAKWKYGRGTPLQTDALVQFHGVVLKEGLDSISDTSIAFHLKGVLDKPDDSGIRRYHALVHGLCGSDSIVATGYTSSFKSLPKPPTTEQGSLVLDFLSIGSLSRLEFQQAQRSTFGLHPSVRYFFNVTEDDDADRSCSKNLSKVDVLAISNFCREKKWSKTSLMSYQRNHYATRNWLSGKQNPAGWMCAQKRPIHGITKALKKYESDTLPDFLIIVDDDSYYQVDLVQKELQKYDSDNPHVIAGCMIRSRVQESNFTIPYGGWGTILSRGAIVNLMRPIYCQGKRQRDKFEGNACNRLQENQLEEQYLFKEGMSVGQLMEAYTAVEPFTSHSNWTHGFCLHSDWALGFFFNFYFIGIHAGGRDDVPHDRMAGYMGSEIYAGRQTHSVQAKRCQCDNDSPETCTSKSHICHYQTPESMKTLTSEWMRSE